jgi:hypothetical protein
VRRVTALSAAAALTLLAGCSGGIGSASQGLRTPDGTAPTSAATTSAATTSAATTSAIPGKRGAPGTTSSSTSAGGSTPGGGGAEQRGNIPKSIGEEGGITDESGEDLLTFVVTAITPDPVCRSGFDDPPLNGHYVAIDLQVATSPSLQADDYVSFSEYDFAFIGPDGITVTSVDGNAWTCLSQEERFTSDALGPGQQYAGTIVVDLPATTGTLIFSPSVLSEPGGWEWQF